jgi:hypothetical protein
MIVSLQASNLAAVALRYVCVPAPSHVVVMIVRLHATVEAAVLRFSGPSRSSGYFSLAAQKVRFK